MFCFRQRFYIYSTTIADHNHQCGLSYMPCSLLFFPACSERARAFAFVDRSLHIIDECQRGPRMVFLPCTHVITPLASLCLSFWTFLGTLSYRTDVFIERCARGLVRRKLDVRGQASNDDEEKQLAKTTPPPLALG